MRLRRIYTYIVLWIFFPVRCGISHKWKRLFYPHTYLYITWNAKMYQWSMVNHNKEAYSWILRQDEVLKTWNWEWDTFHLHWSHCLNELPVNSMIHSLMKFFSFKFSMVSFKLTSRGMKSMARLFTFSLDIW